MSAALAGLRIVVSAGPTFEDIDPVRFLGNRSSGKMGFAVADSARRRGAEVLLVAGPVHLPTPAGVTRVDVRSATQMREAVFAAFPADIYIGAAAVADYTPRAPAANKIKKSNESLALDLVRTPDILSEVAAQTQGLKLVVGFAAETAGTAEALLDLGRAKLARKGCDLLVLNDVSGGAVFGAADNTVTILAGSGVVDSLAGDKNLVAHRIRDAVVNWRKHTP